MNKSKIIKDYEALRERDKLKRINLRLKSLIASTALEGGIKLKQGDNWSYNVSEKILYYPVEGSTGVKEAPAPLFIGGLLHELGHVLFSDPMPTDSLAIPKRACAMFLNTLEDIRIERKLMEKYIGTYDNLSYIYHREIPNSTMEKLPPSHQILFNILRKYWGVEEVYTDPRAQEFVEDNITLFDEALECKTTNELLDYILENLWEKYKIFIEEEQSGKGKSKKGKTGKGKSKKGKNGEGEESGGSEEAGGKALGNNAESQNSDSEDSQSTEEKMGEGVSGDSDKGMTSIREVFISGAIDTDMEKSLYAKETDSSLDVDDHEELTKSDFEEEVEKYTRGMDYEQLYNSVKVHIPFFQKKLQSILEDNKLNRHGGCYNSGKLSHKGLYKFKCRNTKLFTRKVLRQHKQYSVCLLVDESGSMASGSKIKNATKASVLLAEVLNNIKVDFSIMGFHLTVRTYKKYGEPYNWKVKRNIETIMPQVWTHGAIWNNDGYAINTANYLLQQQEGEKILIVLSDGEPAEYKSGIPVQDKKRLPVRYENYTDFGLSQEIYLVARCPNTTIIGVGLNARHVANYYTNSVICDEVSELPKLILGLLQKRIKRG